MDERDWPELCALTLRNLAHLLTYQGEAEQAVRLAEQAVTLARSVGEPSLLAWMLLCLGQATDAMGDFERSERLYGEMLDMARQAGDETMVTRALGHVGNVVRIRGDSIRARMMLEEALSMARPRHDKWLTSVLTGYLSVAVAPEDPAQVLMLREESLALSHEIGLRLVTISGLEHLAGVLASSDRAELSAVLLGASESLRDAFGFARRGSEQAAANYASAAARKRLGYAAFDAAWSRGRAMTADEAVALALGRRTAPSRVERTQRPGGLTGREIQVVMGITRGLTNREIAERLGISERTVDAHVQNVLNKLGMDRRAQLAAWAATRLPQPAPN